jgi:hypothetical protein
LDARLACDEPQQLHEVGIVVDEGHVGRASVTHSSMSASIAFVP